MLSKEEKKLNQLKFLHIVLMDVWRGIRLTSRINCMQWLNFLKNFHYQRNALFPNRAREKKRNK